jgi:hypothetical protein
LKCSIDDPQYVSESSFANDDGSMQIVPSDIDQPAACSVYDFPDAESVYEVNRTGDGY